MATMHVKSGHPFRIDTGELGSLPEAIARSQHIRSFVAHNRQELHAIIEQSKVLIERSRQVRAEKPLPDG